MLQKRECASQRLAALALSSALLFCSATPLVAWSGESLSAPEDSARDRPDYDTILAEKISRNLLIVGNDARMNFLEAALNSPQSPFTLRVEPVPTGTRYSAGWDMPLGASLTTGPVAQYAPATAPLSCPQCDFSRDGVATLGWRVDSQLAWIAPYAQLSYSYQPGDGVAGEARDRLPDDPAAREAGWVDVSVGAHIPLNHHVAAFAAFSQNDALNSGEQFIYSLGVSASF
ncbi:autotransporter [Pantoea sp.]|uniref:autotransporter n=1 Tax=Pantoea sp. TaxID=69393 RepID=UPI0028A9C068|nr:autotransporter [Pantoea sp.]